jgi:hypothetical protein
MTDTADTLRAAADQVQYPGPFFVARPLAEPLARLLRSAAADELSDGANPNAVALARAILATPGYGDPPEAAETAPDGGQERPDTRSAGAETSEAQSAPQAGTDVLRPGDRVRVTYEGEFVETDNGTPMLLTGDHPNDRWHNIIPAAAIVERVGPELDRLRGQVAELEAAREMDRCEAVNLRRRAERADEAEAALERVRAECDRLEAVAVNANGVPLTPRSQAIALARRVRAAIDGGEQA